MEDFSKLKKETETYANIGFTQSETIEQLLAKGFTLDEIKNEIFNYYPLIHKSDILKSFSFIFSFSIITILSLSPLIGYFFEIKHGFALGSLFLLITAIGYYKLFKISFFLWMIFFSILILYMLVALYVKISGHFVNMTFSYKNMIAVLLLSTTSFTSIYQTFKSYLLYKKQYKFE
ncbi:hypothetical protein ACHRVZ_14280 [Flavobacterium sp. FlaQc-57]|uniref:hypothetical protein n=1 Tax=Flavobacterium sp. FlaQc-57 TaxID=3374186 RepID=UPI003756C774